jgi:hypothetical protein
MANFKIPPVSTLLGSTTTNFIKVVSMGRVEFRYYHKVLLSFLVTLIGAPFRLYESIRDKFVNIEEKSPVFILGHWRSGTTFLHNLLCQGPDVAYLSTYQSLFPHNVYSKWIFKSFVRWKIPDKRPSDDVKLGADLPQEDDFAMANIIPSFYCFFFFPDQYLQYYNRHVAFTDGSKYANDWLESYHKLILKAKNNVGGKSIVLKNPANTGRVKQLLEQYPNARFIHIYRNPVTIYLSTKKFFLSLFPTVQLQNTTEQQIIDMIFVLYRRLMTDYIDQKKLIPKENLYEVAYEDFETNPLDSVKDIYHKLNFGDWTKAEPYLKKYLGDNRDYKKNKYKISQKELDRLLDEWSFVFDEYHYKVPANLEVI